MTQSENPVRDDATPAPLESNTLFGSGEEAPPGSDPAGEPESPVRSIADDLRDLATDAQTLLEAEKAYQGARFSYALNRGKSVAVGLGMAAGLAYFAVISLVVGLLLALTPLLTAWGALAVVTLTLLLAAYLSFHSAMKRLRRMRTYLSAAASSEPMS